MIPVMIMRPTALAHEYLQTYAPTNLIIVMVRRGGADARVVCGLVALSTMFALGAIVMSDAAGSGGPGWLNLFVLLFAWNSTKLAWTTAMCPIWNVTRARRLTQGLELESRLKSDEGGW